MCLSVFGYRTGGEAVEITLLGFPVRRIRYSGISDIVRGSKGAFGEVWTFFKLWDLVTIVKKEGRLKYVTVAPGDPERFVNDVKKHLRSYREQTGKHQV